MHTHPCAYIYKTICTYKERERDKEKHRETEAERKRPKRPSISYQHKFKSLRDTHKSVTVFKGVY